MQTRQWLVPEPRGARASTVHLPRPRAEMHVALEIMPGKRVTSRVMPGVRLQGTFYGGFGGLSSAYMTTSTLLSKVRQNSSLPLVNRNTRGWGGTQCHRNGHRTPRGSFHGGDTHSHHARRLGPEHSHSENNDFPL